MPKDPSGLELRAATTQQQLQDLNLVLDCIASGDMPEALALLEKQISILEYACSTYEKMIVAETAATKKVQG